jgi:tryptophan synthase alpha chain
MTSLRLQNTFENCAAQGRAALITFISAGDPDLATSLELLLALPDHGADVVELGMPFSDPMADGPAIQAATRRALVGGQTMAKTLDMARAFRAKHPETPLVLMGYFNPIYIYGAERFCMDAAAAGVDGLIVVDLPPEESGELTPHMDARGLSLIRLLAPTTHEERLPKVYFISITGITGTATPDFGRVAASVDVVRRYTNLPVAMGFGVKTVEHARAAAECADAVVVGSVLVEGVAATLKADGRSNGQTVEHVSALVRGLAEGIAQAAPKRAAALRSAS